MFDPHFIRQPLMMQARGCDGGGDVHVVVEHVDDHLQHRGDDAAAAGRARHQHRLAVFQHDGRRHRRQRPLAGAGQIGLEADQAEGIRRAGRRGEIVELVVEQHAGAVGDQPDAIAEIQRVGVADRVARTVDHRKMRGVAAFMRRRRRQHVGPRRRVVGVDAGALLGGIVLRHQGRDRRVDEGGIAEIVRAIGIGALHRLDHQMQRGRRALLHVRQRKAFEDIERFQQHHAAGRRQRHRDDVVAAIGAAHRRADRRPDTISDRPRS